MIVKLRTLVLLLFVAFSIPVEAGASVSSAEEAKVEVLAVRCASACHRRLYGPGVPAMIAEPFIPIRLASGHTGNPSPIFNQALYLHHRSLRL